MMMSPTAGRRLALLGALCLALAACASPVGTVRVDPKVVLRDIGRSAISTGEPSLPTRNVLFERGLFEAFNEHPEAAIAELHPAMVAAGGDQNLLFALAELSLLHGQTGANPGYYLAAAVYVYAFLFPEATGGAAPGRFDPRLRTAADLYNWALTAAFASGDGSEVVPRGGTFELPFGRIEVAFDPAALRAGDHELYRFVPIGELAVHGLAMRYRWSGLGAPLAASTRPIDASKPGRDMVAPRLQEMYNRLQADPDIRGRYQFWFFQYDSGNPIALPSLHLREALVAAMKRLDPEGKDPALRRMVLIGHSQGGLLVKMQVINSGDRIWNAASREPLDQLVLSDQTRGLLRRGLFVEPLPEVSRVVFICTPHRGSFVAGRNIIANLVRRLATLPFAITGMAADIARNPDAAASVGSLTIPSAVDNMSPRHHFIRALQEIPVAPSVTVNSIIAVETDGPVEQGNDGVVEYSSAHIEPVESELVVKSSHSTQGNPHTVEEVRRILRLHLGLETGTVPLATR